MIFTKEFIASGGYNADGRYNPGNHVVGNIPNCYFGCVIKINSIDIEHQLFAGEIVFAPKEHGYLVGQFHHHWDMGPWDAVHLDLDSYTEYVIRREVNRLMEEQGKIMLDKINKEFEASAGNSVEAKPKYKLTFWQRLELIPIWFMWLFSPREDRKTWHEVKKGMEKHVHKFTVPKNYDGYWFMQCEHEGCTLCEPTE